MTARTLALLLVLPGVASAQAVTRGPYLQSGTPTSVIVKWRTSTSSDARVRYGPSPASLIWFADEAAVTTDHQVTVSGLTPATRYYYSIGTTSLTLGGGDANHFFVTSPPAGGVKPTRAWVIGDSGTANSNAAAVRDAYLAYAGARPTDLWLMLGDNAYQAGTDAEYQAAVFDMYAGLLRQTVLWPTLGNHDGLSADSGTQTGPYYEIFTLPRQGEAGGMPSGTEAYYSFDYGNIHFVCLESYETDRSTSGAMLTWLATDLAATNQQWVVAYWHHPPYSRGSHDSDSEIELIQMRENALPILEAHGVDLVLSGHSHSYERSFLIDGHYGLSGTFNDSMKKDGGDGRPGGDGAYGKGSFSSGSHEGAVYTVAGSSGQISGGLLNHPAMFISLNSLGSLVLNVNGGRLDAVFLDDASVVRDSFTIRKPAFADVPAGDWARSWIEAVFYGGVTGGCATLPLRYCPAPPVTRAQMAAFLLRAKEGGGYAPPPCTVPLFADVPCTHPFAAWVNELAARGITAGCGGGNYCPGEAVTRGQMAVFLLATRNGSGYVPPPCTVAAFADVPCSHPFSAWIYDLTQQGITAGCSAAPPLYCPAASVSRAQMAVFLARTFSLPLD